MSVTVTVSGGPSAAVPWRSGMNAQNALESMWNQVHPTNPAFTFALQYYGSLTQPPLGYLVLMIDGVYDQLQTEPFSYWELIYNGSPSTLGIDDLVLNDGDVVGFTYVTTQAAGGAPSTWKRAKHEAAKATGARG